jgi:hypothetical protein
MLEVRINKKIFARSVFTVKTVSKTLDQTELTLNQQVQKLGTIVKNVTPDFIVSEGKVLGVILVMFVL